MNPEDFRRFEALDEDLDELAAETLDVSDLALRAHGLEEALEQRLEDAERIRAYLGI